MDHKLAHELVQDGQKILDTLQQQLDQTAQENPIKYGIFQDVGKLRDIMVSLNEYIKAGVPDRDARDLLIIVERSLQGIRNNIAEPNWTVHRERLLEAIEANLAAIEKLDPQPSENWKITHG